MSYPTIAVMGGDLRQKWLAYTLAQQNLLSAVYALPDFSQIDAVTLSNLEALNQYQCVIGPVPLARNGAVVLPAETQPLYLTELLQRLQPGQLLAGGNLPADFIQQCHQKKIITYDFMQSPELALANAEITAEGMIAVLLQQTPYILQNTSLLLLGYGRCGMILAQKLTALGCHVSICETDALKRSLACSFGYTVLAPEALPAILPNCELLVNTVPSLLLTYDLLQLLPSQAMLFDLASAPGGIDKNAAKQLSLYYQSCPGLPGKIAPQTAGELLAKDFLRYLNTNPL